MDIIIRPKNYNDAFHFYTHLPFYGFKKCIQKREIVFKQDEVVGIRLDATRSYVVAFSYSKAGFIGTVAFTRFSEKLPISCFENKEIVEGLKTPKEIFKFLMPLVFNKYSPTLWHVAITFALALLFYFLHKTGMVFPSFFNSEIMASVYCDKKCINEGYNYLFSFGLTVSTSILGILICSFIFFVKARLVKNADQYNAIRLTAFLLIVVNLAICSKAITRLQDQRFQTVVEIITNSKFDQEKNKREIASAREFLAEVKKQKD